MLISLVSKCSQVIKKPIKILVLHIAVSLLATDTTIDELKACI